MIHNFKEDTNFDDAMDFGEFLRKKRRLMGLCQADFSQIIGYGHKTISMWETGQTSPSFDIAKSIVEYLGGEIRIVNLKNDYERKGVIYEGIGTNY